MMEAGSVTIQARNIPLNNRQSTASRLRNHPTAQTEPTLQWVVLTGMPRLEAMRTVVADPSSMLKPLLLGKIDKERIMNN